MNENICPKAANCPLFNGEMLASRKAQAIYLELFCKNGEVGRLRCKRYQVSTQYDKPEPSLMPNDPRTVEGIIQNMKSRGL